MSRRASSDISGTNGRNLAPPTQRGRACRVRLIDAASELFHARGIDAVSVNEILDAAGAGKSQFYHYFHDKTALVDAVIDHHKQTFAASPPIDSWEELEAFFEAFIAEQAANDCRRGCPIGSLSAGMHEDEEYLRQHAAECLSIHERHLHQALVSLDARGELAYGIEPLVAARFLIATQQGAALLAKTYRDPQRARTVMHHALGSLRPSR